MYLYVIRHGETDWNREKKLLSKTDLALNENGIKQCIKAEELVKNLNYDLVICSPLLRTRQTAEIINSKKVKVIYDDRIIERDSGSLEGVDVSKFNYRQFWCYGKDKISDEESIEECKMRVYDFLDDIKEKYNGKNILIITHNGICRIIYTYFNGFPRKGDIFDRGQENAQLKMYELK